MTVKKVAIIAAAGAVLLAGALTLSMTLITRRKNVGKYGEYAALF